jgi:hypothetical protein
MRNSTRAGNENTGKKDACQMSYAVRAGQCASFRHSSVGQLKGPVKREAGGCEWRQDPRPEAWRENAFREA